MNNDQILPLKLSCFPRTYFEVSPLKWMEIRGLLLPSFLCLPTVASGTMVDSAVVEISPLWYWKIQNIQIKSEEFEKNKQNRQFQVHKTIKWLFGYRHIHKIKEIGSYLNWGGPEKSFTHAGPSIGYLWSHYSSSSDSVDVCLSVNAERSSLGVVPSV